MHSFLLFKHLIMVTSMLYLLKSPLFTSAEKTSIYDFTNYENTGFLDMPLKDLHSFNYFVEILIYAVSLF